MAESAFHWQDDSRNFIRRAEIQKLFDASLRSKEAQLDSNEMNNAIVSIIPADTGKFRNVVPKAVEEFLKTQQQEAWKTIFDSEAIFG